MNRFLKPALVAMLLVAATLLCDTPQWTKDAKKVESSLKTLDTLLSVNPFPNDVPGLQVAITNKTEQLIADLDALNATLQSDLASLPAGERQEALATLAQLLVQVADEGQRLNNRFLDALTVDLVTHYITACTSYYALSNQYSFATNQLPIGVILHDRGGWNVPG
jgi:hypothetical protein